MAHKKKAQQEQRKKGKKGKKGKGGGAGGGGGGGGGGKGEKRKRQQGPSDEERKAFDDLKAKRAARFGMAAKGGKATAAPLSLAEIEKRKARAERFASNK